MGDLLSQKNIANKRYINIADNLTTLIITIILKQHAKGGNSKSEYEVNVSHRAKNNSQCLVIVYEKKIIQAIT